MSRLERFRRYRRIKTQQKLSIMLFVVLLVIGIIVVEWTMSSTIGLDVPQGLFIIDKPEADFYTINLMGKEMRINLDNLRRVFFISD